jgi:patatin-like phospholipase
MNDPTVECARQDARPGAVTPPEPSEPGWPALFVSLGALGVVVVVLLSWVHDLAAVRELDLSVAGTPEVASAIVRDLTPVVQDRVNAVLWQNLLLIAAYVAAVSFGVAWGRGAIKSSSARRGAGWAVAAVMLGGALDVVKVVGVAVMTHGLYGPWPVVTASAAWTRWFLVFPSAGFALYAVYMRAHRDVHRRFAIPSKLALFPQPFEAKRPTRLDAHADWTPPRDAARIGIACSGGGVRSAAYNLGALQALHEERVFQRADYLSAVSGGAYIAAAHAIVHKSRAAPGGFGERFDFAPGSPEERYLRRHLTYLADSTTHRARFAIRLFMGAALNLVFFYLLIFVISRPLAWFLTTQRVHPELREVLKDRTQGLSIPAFLWVAALWPAVAAVLVGWFAILWRFRKEPNYARVVNIAVALVVLSAAMVGVVIALPWLVVYVPRGAGTLLAWLLSRRVPSQGDTRNYLWLLQVLGAVAVLGAVQRLLWRNASRVALIAAGFIVPLSVVLTATLLVADAAARGSHGRLTLFGIDVGEQWAWWLGVTAILAVFYGLSDQTTWSMHPFYKRRLASAYALVRKSPTEADAVKYDDLLKLSEFGDELKPKLILCAAANISDVGAAPTGRLATSFTFTPDEVGGPEVGWIETKTMEDRLGPRRKEDITIEAAVAISGAALSPAMGKMTRPSVTALLTLFNARLGVWLPNPGWLHAMEETEPEKTKWVQRPRAQYLFKEMLGRHRGDDLFVYVTDGGHWENLGLVELLRRGCTEIYSFDAAGDDIRSFFTLGEAIALARTELGVEIDIDPERLEPLKKDDADPREHRSMADHVIGRFRYPNGVVGRLLYCKAAVTEDAPWDVKAYGERTPAFPSHGTVDQFYSDERFEAYRALGFHTVKTAIADPGWRARALEPDGDTIFDREVVVGDRPPPEFLRRPRGALLSRLAAFAARFRST